MKPTLTWDDHTAKVATSSPRWASTDRGWLHSGQPAAYGVSGALGHYLDYGPCGPHYAEKHDGKTVHAVSCVSRRSQWCASVAEAKAWLEAESDLSRLQPTGRMHFRRAGRIEHNGRLKAGYSWVPHAASLGTQPYVPKRVAQAWAREAYARAVFHESLDAARQAMHAEVPHGS
jgi:hypothetical protein